MNTEWHKKPIDPSEVRSLSARHGIDLLSASIFTRRNLTDSEEIRYFLTDDPSLLHNPFLFHEMDVAIERILQAKDEGEKVLVYGDRDADGISSTVIMVEALSNMGIDVGWGLPLGDDPYGLTLEVIDSFARVDGTLLITVDCGISNHEEIAHAGSLGIDTIVIDHHNPGEILPPAHTIINPKIEESGYPFRDLAGCGVTAKVVWALLFSQTRYYNKPVCLLNVRPGNDSVIVDALLMVNLVAVDSVMETIVPGMVEIDQTRLVEFLQNREIVVYDSGIQLRMLKSIFGAGADIGLSDLAPEIGRIRPELRGKSLLKMLEEDNGEGGEIGVLQKLFTAFVSSTERETLEGFSRSLDLVAIGTLADLMPLRNENRILVRKGLEVLSSTRREGLKELLFRKNLYGRKIGTGDIGWQISPLINAAGRLGVPDVAAKLILSPDPSEQRQYVDELLQLNIKRRRLGDEAWNLVLEDARASQDELLGKLVVVGGSQIHRGITGILASKLAKYFRAPAIVIAMLGDKAVGSARSVNGVHIKKLLDKMADLFLDYGGHDFAAGFSMELSMYDEFLRKARELAPAMEEAEDDNRLEIDADLPDAYMTPRLREVLDRFEPYGEGNPPLNFAVRKAVITDITLIGKREQNHVKMLVETGKSKWPAVFWNAADRVGRDFSLNDTVDIAFRLSVNNYHNQENLQLNVLDIAR
jgi:single-stranded-DNA-specific exonuclease